MRKLATKLTLSICLLGLSLVTNAQTSNPARLTLHFINNIDSEVEIKQMRNPGSLLTHSSLMASIDENNGEAHFEFDLSGPTDFYWNSKVNQLGGQIILEPGDDLVMRIDRNMGYRSQTFEGIGAERNNFRLSIELEHNAESGKVYNQAEAGEITFSQVIEKRMELLDRTLRKIDQRSLAGIDNKLSLAFIQKLKIEQQYETYQELFLYKRWFRMKLTDEDHKFLESLDVNNELAAKVSRNYLHLVGEQFFYRYYRAHPDRKFDQATYAKSTLKGATLEAWLADRIVGKIQRGFASEEDIANAKAGISSPTLLKDIEMAVLLFRQSQISDYDPETNFIDGEFSSVKDIIAQFKGKVIYIDFWGSWCGPCISGLPNIFRMQKEFANQDVVFLFLAGQDREKYWKRAIKKNQISGYHYLLSDEMFEEATELFEIPGLPSQSLVSKTGEIVDNKPGKYATQELFDKIQRLLDK